MTGCFWQELNKADTWCKGQAELLTSIDIPTGLYFVGIAASSDIVVIVGENGFIYTTSKDLTGGWTERTVPAPLAGSTDAPHNIIWTGSRFVIAGHWDGSVKVLHSQDGITWTQGASDIPNPAGNGFNDIVMQGSDIILSGRYQMAKSTDNGDSWTAQTVTSALWSEVTASPDMIIAVRWGAGYVLRSVDGGASYQYEQMLDDTGGNGDSVDIAWNGSVFMASDSNGSIFTTVNGLNWTTRSYANVSVLLGFENGDFIAISYLGEVVKTSNNGETWEQIADFELSAVQEYSGCSHEDSYYAIDLWVTSGGKIGGFA